MKNNLFYTFFNYFFLLRDKARKKPPQRCFLTPARGGRLHLRAAARGHLFLGLFLVPDKVYYLLGFRYNVVHFFFGIGMQGSFK